MMKIREEVLEQNLKIRLKQDLSDGNLFGAAVKVCQQGKVVFEGTFGTTGLDGTESIQSDTVFRLASMTKPITAVAVMILVERGILHLDDLVEMYLPAFCNMHIMTCDEEGNLIDKGLAKTKMNIFHLLTHCSGICNGKIGEIYLSKMTAEDKLTLDSAMKYYANTGLAFEPQTSSEYNAFVAFDILAKIIEQVTGQDYEQFLSEHIFKPCCMKDTTFQPTQEQWGRMVQMHHKKDGKVCAGEMIDGCVFGSFPPTHYLAGAGLISTISDYSNFAEMLLHNGTFRGNRILSSETVKMMSTPYRPMGCPPDNQKWGLGMRVITGADYEILPVGAFGWSGAYGTHFWVDPVNQISAVYMKNSLYDGGSGAKTARNFEEDVFQSLA